jgi:hypothetical protein
MEEAIHTFWSDAVTCLRIKVNNETCPHIEILTWFAISVSNSASFRKE